MNIILIPSPSTSAPGSRLRSCPLHSPPPARTRWTPGHSGHIRESLCTFWRAAGGFGPAVCEFRRISQCVSRPTAQQGSPNWTSLALERCYFSGLRVLCSNLLGCSGLNTAGYHTGIVVPDLRQKNFSFLAVHQRGLPHQSSRMFFFRCYFHKFD